MIPAMTDPLGRYWKQPTRDQITLDETHALMPRSAFDQLVEYSRTIPTGTYPGKMWKANPCSGVWVLRWYGAISENGETIERGQRIIVLVEGE